MTDYNVMAKEMKADSFRMASLSEDVRNGALAAIADALEENSGEIFRANEADLENGKDLPAPILGRLKFDRHKLDDCVTGIKDPSSSLTRCSKSSSTANWTKGSSSSE